MSAAPTPAVPVPAAPAARLAPRDALLGVLVAVIWGCNFALIRWGVEDVPPLLLAALRFTFVFAIAAPFVPRRGIPWKFLVPIGLALGVGQFGFLFVAIDQGMPSGLAATVLQVQAVFTALLAITFLGERLSGRAIGGLAIAVGGLVLIGADSGASATVLGFALTIAGGLCWAVSNIVTRKAGKVNGLSLVVWSSAVPPIPLYALSLLIEGPSRDLEALRHPTLAGIVAVLYIGIMATIVGYGLWNRLLSRYPASSVAPFSLLVPPVGLFVGWLTFAETPDVPSLIGAALVITGIAVANVRFRRMSRAAS